MAFHNLTVMARRRPTHPTRDAGRQQSTLALVVVLGKEITVVSAPLEDRQIHHFLWMERGIGSNHRAAIPILTRGFGSEPPSGVPSGLQEKAPLSAGLELARGWRSLLARP